MPFPLAFYYPSLYKKQAQVLVESRTGVKYDETDLSSVKMTETAVLKNAEECLNLISQRLGSNPYLFGQAPTSADAVLFSLLAPLVKAPFVNPTLQNYVQNCPNLTQFVQKIVQTYFAKTASEFSKKAEKAKQAAESKADESKVSWRELALSGSVALAAFSTYAYVKKENFKGFELVSDEDEDYNEYENESETEEN